jgi:hypothetical protein
MPSVDRAPRMGRALGRVVPFLLWFATVAGSAAVGGFHLSLLVAHADAGDPSLVSASVAFAAYASLGWLIVRRRPGHRVGWLFLATALVLLAVFSGFTFGPALGATRGRDDLAAGLLIWSGIVLYVPAILMAFPLLAVLFPDGHLPGPGWRAPVLLLILGAATASLCLGLSSAPFDAAAADNPFAVAALPIAITAVGVVLAPVVILAGGVLGIAAIVARFRRGRGDERQQVKWMLAAVILVVVLDAPLELGFQSEILGIAVSLGLMLIPGATTLAILRYRLYDIDRLVSRTLAYALLTGTLAALAVGGNLVVQTVLAGLTQANTIAVAISTLLVFVVAQPLLHRMQRLVDRRFDRTRIDAERTVAAFAERQRDQVDLVALVEDMRWTASASVRPASVGVWLMGADRASSR